MDLETWMKKNGKGSISEDDQTIADAVGVTRSYITKIRYGRVHPSLGTALNIWNYTNRDIALESLLPVQLRKQHAVAPVKPQPAKPAAGKPRKPVARKASRSPASA